MRGVAGKPICADCGLPMVLRWTKKFGGRHFYGCSGYPRCKATHGAHPDGRPLGTPANHETKQARIKAHALFDSLWRSGGISRRDAYRWLQNAMNLAPGAAHIGEFNLEQCNTLITLLENQSKP